MQGRIPAVLFITFMFATLVAAQSTVDVDQPGDTAPSAPEAGAGVAQSTRSQRAKGLVTDTIGAYSIAMALFTAGIHQGTDNPAEWHQGMSGFSKRFASNMGITAVGNTTRFGIGELLTQDTSFHRCRCKEVPRRLGHAAISALMARRRSDRSEVFSIPGLVAPYAATMTAVYAWYPERYGAKDAFRMGNYNLLGAVGSNITFEFLPRQVWNLMGRFHVKNNRVSEE